MNDRKLGVIVAPARQPKGRGAHFVYSAMRDKILRLDLRPGVKLDEAALVESLGVSRTPVREAFVRLAAEGLVFLLPNRGAQVAPLDLTETARYFEALDLVQRVVNNWAAVRRTREDLDQIQRVSDRYDE